MIYSQPYLLKAWIIVRVSFDDVPSKRSIVSRVAFVWSEIIHAKFYLNFIHS